MAKEIPAFYNDRLLAELIYNSAYLDGMEVLPEKVHACMRGGHLDILPPAEFKAVHALRAAWRYAIENRDIILSFHLVCEINELATNMAGHPKVEGSPLAATNAFQDIRLIQNPVEQALECFCYILRSGLFRDCNTATAAIAASKVLMEYGKGVLTIDPENAVVYREALEPFYAGHDAELKEVLMACIRQVP